MPSLNVSVVILRPLVRSQSECFRHCPSNHREEYTGIIHRILYVGFLYLSTRTFSAAKKNWLISPSSLLWTTWLVTTLFDARFGQDGILERIARAFHLAVMIGFAEAGVSFEKQNLVRAIFQSMCKDIFNHTQPSTDEKTFELTMLTIKRFFLWFRGWSSPHNMA